MSWLDEVQLFLFDFDGLLVNTEEIHYQAYKNMCKGRGFDLPWDFPYYCTIAHYSSDGLRQQIYATFPELQKVEPDWKVLYAEKKQAFLDLVEHGAVHLMPGAERLLLLLQKADKKRCVVTHSSIDLIHKIIQQNPLLKTIPEWITREDYTHAKPDPECYLKAIETWAAPEDRIVGFEDTPRGMTALFGTRAQPVIVTTLNYAEIPEFLERGAHHFRTLDAVCNALSKSL